MKYSVDRIENDIVVLENINSGAIINVEKSVLPFVTEGNILILKDGKYILDKNGEEQRRISLTERFKNLKRQ